MINVNDLVNMKMSDFENLGQTKYNEGFRAGLETVVKLLDSQVCEDFRADDACDHDGCIKIASLAEGIVNVKNNIQ